VEEGERKGREGGEIKKFEKDREEGIDKEG
jgi:hypothetical protein